MSGFATIKAGKPIVEWPILLQSISPLIMSLILVFPLVVYKNAQELTFIPLNDENNITEPQRYANVIRLYEGTKQNPKFLKQFDLNDVQHYKQMDEKTQIVFDALKEIKDDQLLRVNLTINGGVELNLVGLHYLTKSYEISLFLNSLYSRYVHYCSLFIGIAMAHTSIVAQMIESEEYYFKVIIIILTFLTLPLGLLFTITDYKTIHSKLRVGSEILFLLIIYCIFIMLSLRNNDLN